MFADVMQSSSSESEPFRSPMHSFIKELDWHELANKRVTMARALGRFDMQFPIVVLGLCVEALGSISDFYFSAERICREVSVAVSLRC